MLRAGLILLYARGLKLLVALAHMLASVEWFGSEAVLCVEEGWSLHYTTHNVVVAWFEQVKEGIGNVFANALRIFTTGLVGSSEQSITWVSHSIALSLLLSSWLKDSATIDTNWCELGVLTQNVRVVVRRGV